MLRLARTRALLAATLPLACLGPGPAAAEDPSAYEHAAPLRARELLPAALLRGPHHAVEESVESDGFVPIFRVVTDHGTFRAHGEDALRARIAEAEALARLAEAAEAPRFRAAAASAPAFPFVRGGWSWRPDPDAATPGLAAGALAGGPWAQGSGAAAASPLLLGFEETRRELAGRLGVDPYSSNPALQEALDRHAWVAFSSGEPSALMAEAAPPDAAPAGDEAVHSERVEELLEHYSSRDLERLNRLELVAMGVPEELRERFIQNPAFSPRHETALLDALADLEGTEDRVSFIRAAVDADSEAAAASFQRVAEMLRQYSEDGGGLARLLEVDGQVAAYAQDGTLVVPVLAEHAVWSQRVEGFAESIARAAGASPEAARARLLVSGSVSARALDEIRERGIDVTEGALEPEDPPAPDAPGE